FTHLVGFRPLRRKAHDQLRKAGFQVTILTRAGNNHSFPASVHVAHVDYESLDSLTHALHGQDAVVSTLASVAITVQLHLVETAARAHVKRFIPSEFGSNTLHEKSAALPVFADKVKVQAALKKEASSSGLTYTLICNGPFLDWGIAVGFIMNLKGKSIDLFDGGDRYFSATNLATIGNAVAGVLHHPEETKNRAVYVHDTVTTQKKLSAFGKKATADKLGEWKENIVSIDELYQQGWAELKKPQPNPDGFIFNFLKTSIWGYGYGSHFEHTDNALLGIKEISDAELEEEINGLAKQCTLLDRASNMKANEQSQVRAVTSFAAAPITVKVTDSAYSEPAGQLQGVPELVEHTGREADALSAAELRNNMPLRVCKPSRGMKLNTFFTCLLYMAAAVVEAAPQNSSEAAASRQIIQWQRQYNRYIGDTIKKRKTGGTKDKIIFRQEWGSLSFQQRIEYTNAVQCLAKKRPLSLKTDVPGARNHYDDFVAQHIKVAPNRLFFPFHRYYVHLYEKALREECGYRGTQPYWDWSLSWQDPAHGTVFDGSPTSMGGNGKLIPNSTATNITAFSINLILPPTTGGSYVQHGPFKEGTFTVNLGPAVFNPNAHGNGLGYNPRCIKRDISTVWAANTRPTYVLYQLTACGDDFGCFGAVTEALNGTHTGGHYTFGGDPGFDPYASAGDPMLFLHHAQVDRLWTIWQALNPSVGTKQIYGTETAFNSPPSPNVTLTMDLDFGILAPKQKVGTVLSSVDGPFCYAYI
ncbi:MAG: hypothetical protein Q9181_004572, partial [Wetmoreana brouardii]